MSIFPESAIDFIFFTDEKVFTVALPVNLQNDRVYAPCGMKKHDIVNDRLLCTRLTFSKSVVVSVAFSKLGRTELIFEKAESEGRRCLLPRCSGIAPDASCKPTSGRRCVRVPAG